MAGCTLDTDYQRKGIDVLRLENDHLRVEVLAGKGGDITEITDKRTDTNVLFETPHEWYPPANGPIGAQNDVFDFLDHYPGGWQDVLPAAGGPATMHGAPLSLHGESSLVPWEVISVERGNQRVAATLSVSLSRYPFDVTREIALEADDPNLYVAESITNRGGVGAHYSWLQHIALGPPLIDPAARVSVPCERVLVDPDHDVENARLPPGETFEWPIYRGDGEEVDLRRFPPREERIHDLVALTDLTDGVYRVENPELDLGVEVRFPADVFEYLWYWQPLGGVTGAPFFGRNYNVGLEPCTSIPNAGLERAIENGTANHLDPGEEIEASIGFRTYPVPE